MHAVWSRPIKKRSFIAPCVFRSNHSFVTTQPTLLIVVKKKKKIELPAGSDIKAGEAMLWKCGDQPLSPGFV